MPRKRLPADERKRQIARVVLEIVASGGANQLTAAEIARRVGVSDAALFRHFADKRAIVAAAIETFEALLFENFPPTHADPLERLHQLFVQRVALVRRYPEIMQLAFDNRLAEAAGPAGVRRVRSMVDRSVGFVRECLAQAQQHGMISPDVSVNLLSWAVMGIIRGAASDTRKRRPSPETLWQQLERLLRGSS
jgi:AcrR family transcriptional regulator